MAEDLLALAGRVEAASEGSYALENEIAAAIGRPGSLVPLPYTVSIDAAMTLVPRPDVLTVEMTIGRTSYVEINDVLAGDGVGSSVAATPALALCAAALRARSDTREVE